MRLERVKANSERALSDKLRISIFKARGGTGCVMRPCLIYSVISLFLMLIMRLYDYDKCLSIWYQGVRNLVEIISNN